MNLLNLKEVSQQTGFNEDELRDLMSKDIFPQAFGIVEHEKRWSQDDVRIWVKIHNPPLEAFEDCIAEICEKRVINETT